MSKPKHRRCRDCGLVTSRYVRTQNAGAFSITIWARDPRGEVMRDYGDTVLCVACAVEQPQPVDPDVEELEAWVRGETSVLGNPELDAVTAMRRSRRVQ